MQVPDIAAAAHMRVACSDGLPACLPVCKFIARLIEIKIVQNRGAIHEQTISKQLERSKRENNAVARTVQVMFIQAVIKFCLHSFRSVEGRPLFCLRSTGNKKWSKETWVYIKNTDFYFDGGGEDNETSGERWWNYRHAISGAYNLETRPWLPGSISLEGPRCKEMLRYMWVCYSSHLILIIYRKHQFVA